jgi:hypothetical protein
MLKLTAKEQKHWKDTQRAVLASFNFWSKRQVNAEFVTKLASEIADAAVIEYRRRVK